ncbi:MAG: aminoglycoside phosphotransferase [Comamonadaceae bacterium]|nr:MAG: aminoglycoside phosphotransferase [Comamonadaceae bacterium]
MPDNPEIPLAKAPESPRAAYQALAERVRAVQPGVSLSDELMAFAEGVAAMTRDGLTEGSR